MRTKGKRRFTTRVTSQSWSGDWNTRQVVEDAVDRLGLGDERNDAHFFAAPGTCERVHFKDASQQLSQASLCLT